MFMFISDDVLRRIIERDKREMDSCLTNGNYKAVLVLSGSLIEAVLVDYFLSLQPISINSQRDYLKAGLSQLIDWALDDQLISKQTYEISTVIRSYRNLIHPGKEYRLRERVDKNSATVAAYLVEILLEEISENYSQKRGYTAEAAIAKVKIDPSSSSILKHMVEKMNPTEHIRLFRLIPSLCEAKDVSYETSETFVRLHTILAESMPNHLIQEEANKILDYLHNRRRDETLLYLRFFIRHISHLLPSDKDALLSYLLDILAQGNRVNLIQIKNVDPILIGKLIHEPERPRLLNQTILTRLRDGDSEDDELFPNILEAIFISQPDQVKEKIMKDLKWHRTSRADSWVEAIENFIPF